MDWKIGLTKKAAKQYQKLPKAVRDIVDVLMLELRKAGPIRGNWRNYSKLSDVRHHCHVKKGKPTYVVVWEVVDDQVRVVEVTYVGTHEKAPY